MYCQHMMPNISYVFQQLNDKHGVSLIQYFDSLLIYENLMHQLDLNVKLHSVGISKKLICNMDEEDYNNYQKIVSVIDDYL